MKAVFKVAFSLLAVASCSYVQAAPVASTAKGLSNTTIASVRDRLIQSAGRSWEIGTAAEALTELSWPDYSVFSPNAFPPAPLSSKKTLADVLTIANETLDQKPSTSLALMVDGATGDPASIGVAVLLANWTRTDLTDKSYATAATEQLQYLLTVAPRSDSGAISHRGNQVSIWADNMAMAFPFIAYYGALQGGSKALTLLTTAYKQCSLYRDALQDPDTNLWKHIVLGTFTDETLWGTGNGWAAFGMMRVLQTIRNSNQASKLVSQQADLQDWITEILVASAKYQKSNGAIFNTMDDPSSFPDTASTALLGSVAYRLLALSATNNSTLSSGTTNTLLTFANKAFSYVRSNINDGWLDNTVDPLKFSSPSAPGEHSPEGQAFVLLLQAAWRDYIGASATQGLRSMFESLAPSS